MADWWYRNIVEPGKLPLLLSLTAFLLTFLMTRVITRLIRAGKGPFRNVDTGGTHVHHVVPGVLLMVIGGFTGFTALAADHGFGAGVAAVLFGMGVGLVLDEFALILYMNDVYWTEQGRKSVEVVMITAALGGLVLAGFVPFGVNDLTEEERLHRGGVVVNVLLNVLIAVFALFKGKTRMAVMGVLVPFVALFAAVRLARPDSPWARRFYRNRSRARARAETRARRHDARWDRLRRRLQDAVAGAPDT